MESRAKLFGHPIHQMLIVFPLGLLATSVVLGIIKLITGRDNWAPHSYWTIVAGIIGALLAAVFGLIDWLPIPKNTRAKAIGLYHGALNFIVTVLFVVSCILRMGMP